MSDKWIWIPNWDGPTGFQHYKGRDPIWIKNYTRLLSHDEYRDLSHHQRGVLHSIWMAYATANRRLRGDTLTLTRQLGQRVLTRDLVSLSAAGFLVIVDSKGLAARLHDASDPLALTRARALAREEKTREEKNLGVSSKRNGLGSVHVWQENDEPPDLTHILPTLQRADGGAA